MLHKPFDPILLSPALAPRARGNLSSGLSSNPRFPVYPRIGGETSSGRLRQRLCLGQICGQPRHGGLRTAAELPAARLMMVAAASRLPPATEEPGTPTPRLGTQPSGLQQSPFAPQCAALLRKAALRRQPPLCPLRRPAQRGAGRDGLPGRKGRPSSPSRRERPWPPPGPRRPD